MTFSTNKPHAGSSLYWRRTRRLTSRLLALWLVTTLAIVFFARELAQFTLFGWPVSFYMAAQGTLLIYLAIVAVYAWRMHRLDAMARDEDNHAE